MTAAETALRERIRSAGGSVPFVEFMRFALYDPEHGYYARRVRSVGREGDFSTSATLHSALAEAVAAWAVHHRKDGTADHGQWHLIELGGGSGELAAHVLGSLGWWARRRLQYHLVEVSTGLRATQQAALARWKKTVSWHETLADALESSDGVGLIFSNEFVDAFPCARWMYRDGWHEIRLAWPDAAEAPVEIIGTLVPAADLAFTSGADAEFVRTLPPGQKVEVFASYRVWLHDQLACWSRGRLLTSDYGDACPALYHRRVTGTLRAYCRQQRFTGSDVYARVGRQDLTADVNFTDLRHWGEELGLRSNGLSTQADFLRRWLSPRRIRRARGDARLAFLLDPAGAGGAFKVLEQTCDIKPPAQIGA